MAAMFSVVPYLVSPRHLSGPQLPAAAGSPEQIERRLVFLHLCRRDQGHQDHPRLAAIDHGVVLVAEARSSFARGHRRGVGIGGADAEVGRPSLRPTRGGAVGTTGQPDPVVTDHGVLGQGHPCLLGQGNR
jgi:hypothetical protein